jgi:hypothetical protein
MIRDSAMQKWEGLPIHDGNDEELMGCTFWEFCSGDSG